MDEIYWNEKIKTVQEATRILEAHQIYLDIIAIDNSCANWPVEVFKILKKHGANVNEEDLK